MGCRIPIRQMPSGTVFSKVSDLFGKSEFANPLSDFYHGKMGCRIPIRQMPSGIVFSKVSDLFGKSEFANPLKDLDIIGKERVCQPIKGLRHY